MLGGWDGGYNCGVTFCHSHELSCVSVLKRFY